MVEREEEEKRKIQRELVAKKLAQERTAEEVEKERIRQRMEQDRREKEAEAKLRREMEGTAAATSTIQKPVLDQHGNLTWQHRSIYAAASQTPGQTLSGGSGTLSGGSGSIGGSSSSGQTKPPATAAARPKERCAEDFIIVSFSLMFISFPRVLAAVFELSPISARTNVPSPCQVLQPIHPISHVVAICCKIACESTPYLYFAPRS